MAKPARKTSWIVAGATTLVLLVAGGAITLRQKFTATQGQALGSDLEQFKYGSLGGEMAAGIPYPIFMLLPRVFPDLVGRYATQGYGKEKAAFGGYGAFGLPWEQGKALPIGFSIKQVGYTRVTANCALCHTTQYRMSAEDDPHFAIGGRGNSENIQALVRFLIAATDDRRFTAARLMPELGLNFPLDLVDTALYPLVLIPHAKDFVQSVEGKLGWSDDPWGPGRFDAIGHANAFALHAGAGGSSGATYAPALWHLPTGAGTLLLAGGEAQGAARVAGFSALLLGSPPDGDFKARAGAMVSFLHALEPPKFAAPIRASLVAPGRTIFDAQCASCHAPAGARTGTVIPLAEIGTDPERARAWTPRDGARLNQVDAALGLAPGRSRNAAGYLARPLVGVWLLGPYLHNGSVPTLADLLSPPAERPGVIYRGYDVIDTERVGFVATGAAAEEQGFRFDTKAPGNGNAGHEYGTALTMPQKTALIEYLKTL